MKNAQKIGPMTLIQRLETQGTYIGDEAADHIRTLDAEIRRLKGLLARVVEPWAPMDQEYPEGRHGAGMDAGL